MTGALRRELAAKALKLGVPLSVQLDLTYRCNERCVHCYLDHDDHGEMTTAEIRDLLAQLADAGVFFLTLSGGEIFMRKDLFEIVEHSRRLRFSVKLKTNAVMIRRAKAERIASLGVESVQVSVYSHREDVHDAITKLPGSFRRTVDGIRMLRSSGVQVILANVLMKKNATDYAQVRALADALDAEFTIDPTITPMMDGNRSILDLNLDPKALGEVLHDPSLVGDVDAFCAPPSGPLADEDALETLPCSAGHTACYVSPYGDVYPCVQFPLPCGNVRRTPFREIWSNSPQLADVRSITMHDLASCSTCVHGGSCSRCPGLAYMEGDMRGPSLQDCEKSYARTGVPSRNLLQKKGIASRLDGAKRRGPPQKTAPSKFPVFWLTART
jgi:radical SAM protein with 4Fe4S-binding SPASM domain